MKKWLWWLLGAIFSAMLICGGYQIYTALSGYAQSDAAQQEVVCAAVAVAEAATPTASVVRQDPVSQTETAVETAPITVDFDTLRAVNPDIVGWLYCEDTPINYPVVQGEDNVYYLSHLFNGESNRNGTLFLDWRNQPNFSDDQSVIYGHHMRNGSMFACLVEYRSQEYYAAHPVIYLLTPERDYLLEVFSGIVSDPADEELAFWFGSAAEREAYYEQAVERSDFISDMAMTAKDHIVTLSTCTYEFEDARYLVHTVLRAMG